MPYKPTGRAPGRPRRDGSPPQPSKPPPAPPPPEPDPLALIPPPPAFDEPAAQAESEPSTDAAPDTSTEDTTSTPADTGTDAPTQTPTETPTKQNPDKTTNPDRKTDAERVALWQDQANRTRAKRLKLTPSELWTRWEDFKKECTKPGRFPTLTGFALSVGQYNGRLDYLAERSVDFSAIVEKVKLDQARLAEEHLVSSRFPAGAIFWAKNRLGFRDKSPAEVKEAADWLDALASGNADRRAANRDVAPPQPDGVLQLLDAEPLAQDEPNAPGFNNSEPLPDKAANG